MNWWYDGIPDLGLFYSIDSVKCDFCAQHSTFGVQHSTFRSCPTLLMSAGGISCLLVPCYAWLVSAGSTHRSGHLMWPSIHIKYLYCWLNDHHRYPNLMDSEPRKTTTTGECIIIYYIIPGIYESWLVDRLTYVSIYIWLCKITLYVHKLSCSILFEIVWNRENKKNQTLLYWLAQKSI